LAACLLISIFFVAQGANFAEFVSAEQGNSPSEIAFDRNMIFPKYVLDAPTPTNIFVADLNFPGKERQLTGDDRSEYPTWSPDGSRIAFVHINERAKGANRRNPAFEIFVMNADGKDQKQVASFQSIRQAVLSWSPDGQTLAVGGAMLPAVGVERKSGIYLVNTILEEPPRLISENGGSPSWSPDGEQIVYTCSNEIKPGQYATSICSASITSDHPQPQVLVENGFNPTWSPNGENIAYSSRIRQADQLFVCHPDGSQVIQISDGKYNALSFPQSYAWSPDGNRIAFLEKHSMEDEVIVSGPLHTEHVPQIFVADMGGRRIGPLGEKEHLWCHSLSWSPHGESIAAICASGLRDPKTRKQRFATSLFVVDSTNPKSNSQIIARNVQRAVFSPR